MGDTYILAYDDCETKISQLSLLYVYSENCLQMCQTTAKLVMINANYHNIT